LLSKRVVTGMPPHNRPAPGPWVAVGVPLDCSGRSRGEETAPAALREAGVRDALAIEDLGDAHGLIDEVEPDSASGLIAHGQLKARRRANRVPVVLGGGRALEGELA